MNDGEKMEIEETIDLQEVFEILKKRLGLIVLLAIIGATVLGAFTNFFETPMYQTSTQLLVSRLESENNVTGSEISANIQIINTFNDILVSPIILNQVIEELNLGITAGQLRGSMTAANRTNSQVITLRVQHESPTIARDVANTTAEIFERDLPTIMNVDSVHILAEAELPRGPIANNLTINISMGFLGGAMMGMFLAFLLNFLDKRVKSEQEVEKLVNVPTLGIIEFDKKRKRERGSKRNLTTSINPKSPISEQYRTIRTNIQFLMIDKEIKTLAFTSAAPGEGKTTTIANLAITLAYQGDKVLLIDADLRKPTLHQLIGVRNQHGLTNLITKKSTKKSAILRVPRIANLYVLPSGPIPPNPSELLNSKKMKNLISELSQEYDWVLFDTPPVLAVTDAQILANRCDGVILVLKSNQTQKEELVKAKELLDKANTNLMGTIMSGVNRKDSGYGYYYGNED